jgi:hypothetical protein
MGSAPAAADNPRDGGRRGREGATMADPVGVLDGLVARVLAEYPYRFTVASADEQRRVGYVIRGQVLAAAGLRPAAGPEQDEYDPAAVHLIGWDGDEPVCTGRIVVPPSALPTERECGIVVEPAGRVADVGRMAVVPARQSVEHAVFVALLCRLYLEVRTRGFEYACGMMSRRARRLVRLLGLVLDELGDDRPYWGEPRAPVRFAVTTNAPTVRRRWP